LFKSWLNLQTDGIVDAFAEAVLPRLKKYLSICPVPRYGLYKSAERPSLSDDTRKALIIALVNKITDFEHEGFNLISSDPQLISEKDISWLIDRLTAETDGKIVLSWVTLIWFIFRMDYHEHFESVYWAMQKNKPLYEKFHALYGPIELGSSEAGDMKTRFAEREKREKDRFIREANKKQPSLPSVNSRIQKCLDRFDSGDYGAWWQLCLEMTIEENNSRYGNELEADLTHTPGWKNSHEEVKNSIIEAAKKYVYNADAETGKWLGKNILHRPALAGYKALILLKKHDPGFWNVLTADIWKKWASIIVGYPVSAQDDINRELICGSSPKCVGELS